MQKHSEQMYYTLHKQPIQIKQTSKKHTHTHTPATSLHALLQARNATLTDYST